MNRAGFFLALWVLLAAARFCHLEILWAEETLPMAAAAQIEAGKTLYRDAWFDKPPLVAGVDVLWGARAGWPVRLAGSLYGLLVCALIYALARSLWSDREAYWAAALLAFFLVFDVPSAVTPIAADLLMMAPHIAAVYLAVRNRPLWAGVLAAVAFLVHTKGLLVFAACALWCWPAWPLLLLGFAAGNGLGAAWMWWQGSWNAYIQQVWTWGFQYAASTFVEHPVLNGLERTANWLGFHSALAIGGGWFWWHREKSTAWRLAAWAVLSLMGTALGWRFFPRYYFQILPVLVLAAARGIVLLGSKRLIALVALLVPLIRFGPRYLTLASDLFAGRTSNWSDIAMDQDSRQAAALVRGLSKPGDTLFVWGFRPEMFVYAGLPAGTRFLDSQPLTGVPADRHLMQSEPVAVDFMARHRVELARTRPTFVLDGLSAFNTTLSMDRYAELQTWLSNYTLVARTKTYAVYHLLPLPAGSALLEKR